MIKRLLLFIAVAVLCLTAFIDTTKANKYQLNPSQAGLTAGTYEGFVDKIVTFGLFAAGAAGIIYLIYGSINYITAGGDETKAVAARRSIINSIIGLVLVTMSFFIVRNAVNLGNLFSSTADNSSDALKNP